MLVRLARALVTVLLALFIVIQFVPYGRAHTNPPVRQEPSLQSTAGRQLAVTTCFDCHSNQTVWPWYSAVAPASWAIQRHVDEGRAALNFSEWDQPQEEGGEAAETLQEGSMPPRSYTLLHPAAALNAAQRDALLAELTAVLGRNGGENNADENEDD